jgi:putative flippase GtrA
MRALARVARVLAADQRVRFTAVGGFNTAFGYLIFVVLVLQASDLIHYTVLLLVAHLLSVVVGYALHRTVVFRVRGGRVVREFFRFWSVQLAAVALNLITLPLLVEVVAIDVLVAQALVVCITAVSSYVAHKHFSFRTADTPSARQATDT